MLHFIKPLLSVSLFFSLFASSKLFAQLPEYIFPRNQLLKELTYEGSGILNFRIKVTYEQKEDVVVKKTVYSNIGAEDSFLLNSYKLLNYKILLVESFDSFFGKFNLNEIVLKAPPAAWKYIITEGEEEFEFTSEEGAFESEGRQYKDGIIVTKAVTKTTEDWAKDTKDLFYYAKGVGLVKQEAYIKDRIVGTRYLLFK